MSTKHIEANLLEFSDDCISLEFDSTQNPKILSVTFKSPFALIYFFTLYFDNMRAAKYRTKVVGNTMLVWEQK